MNKEINELKQQLHQIEQTNSALRQRITDLEQVIPIPAAHAPIMKAMVRALIAHHPQAEAVGKTFVEFAQEIRQGLADQWASLPIPPQQAQAEQASLDKEIVYWQQIMSPYQTAQNTLPHKPKE